MSTREVKQHLRARMRARRERLSLRERELAARKVAENAMAHLPLHKTDVIAGYWPHPTHGELDIRLLLETLEEKGYPLCLPAAEAKNKPLIFRRYKRGDVLVPHAEYGIDEPAKSCKEATPNVLLCPLLAFDKNGFRLGFGGGYYDRTIRKLHLHGDVNKRLLVVGLAYDFQQVDHVPVEPRDEMMDVVITDKQVVLCRES